MLIPLADTRLPDWCDGFLPGDDAFLGRAWWDTTLRHALPSGARPVLAQAGGAALLPLLEEGGGRLRSLTTPYSLVWRPLTRPGAAEAELQAGGRALRPALRLRPPVRLEALGEVPPALLRGLGGAALPYRHFGHWHEALPEGEGWEGYLARRPPALRTTIARKLARAAREARFEWIAGPGAELEAGIAAFEAVRALSWKPEEPSPRFDGALMRALAPLGALRLAVMRRAADAAPLAAQYWVLDAPKGGLEPAASASLTHPAPAPRPVAGSDVVGGSASTHPAPGPRRATVPKLFHVETAKAASPGTALTAFALRTLIEAEGVRALDFGRGDDRYKAQWVGAREQRMGLVLASPWHPLGWAEIARAGARRVLRRVL